ncbi:hypothetical protein [Mycolicibacterium sp. 050158]|uniref:hypothetical protein n=1 Tax=Mycolicibacterium sp. 050158 TaxID=3090602 RepID=UPI00299DCFF4|nr:hypothetical protein [Mycolicibacterium sp. 050158]MDX1892259.1 hypothetical protein [Mycolicibacterium sp. 050158]
MTTFECAKPDERTAGKTPALAEGFDATIDAVAHEIATSGTACLRNVVSERWLETACDYVRTSVDLDGKQELFIENFAADPRNFAGELFADPRLATFLRAVAGAALPRLRAEGQPIETELRVIDGPPRTDDPLWFHYDGTAVTMVLPILIPKAAPGASGELILCPNRRPFRRSVVTNIAEKFLSQNRRYRRRFVERLPREANVATVTLEPGNAYLFSGYRSYHATLPCPPDSLRVTLILHFGNVHQDSRLLATARRLYRSVYERSRAHGPTAAVKLAADAA